MSPPDEIQRIFLGADGPALPAAADWLVDHLAGASMDLSSVLVVVPGGRAQRRLMELLAQRSTGRALMPPTLTTLGGLADRLMPDDGPAVASGLASLLAWAEVLREAGPEALADFVSHAPGRDDWPAWWSLAEQVMQAADELGAQLKSIQEVVDDSTHRGDEPRWQVLADLARQYGALLAERGKADRNQARRDAIASGACAFDGTIVLLATADLQPMHKQMLGCLTSPVYPLIAASERDAEGFDALGGLMHGYWNDRSIEIEDGAIRFVDRPSDQAAAVLDAVRDWAAGGELSADEITVGLGDEALAGPIARTLDLAGLSVRTAGGRPVGGARPVVLLRAIAEFANGLRFDKLAQLLRHPDAEAAITRLSGEPTRPWLTLLDRYATDHLAQRPVGGWLGDAAQVQAMDAVYQAAMSLLPEPVGTIRPLCTWAQPIGDALEQVYGQRPLNRYAEQDHAVVVSLEHIGKALEQIAELSEAQSPHCTFAHAVMLLLTQLAGKAIPEPGGTSAIELVGYLELLLDDAPKLVIAGVNEQYIPAPARNSSLLPEGLRQSLDLPGDAHRLARDGYALSAMLGWRSDAIMVVGKRSQAGDPLLPSRLLLKADSDTLVNRIAQFTDEQDDAHQSAPMLLTPGKTDRFLIPRPVLPHEPITGLRVTGFRDYLACPYRFYLKHVLKLDVLDDKAVEISAGGFGTLAHDALRGLASEDMLAVTDVQTITDRLSMSLDRVFRRAYGNDPPVAARVQAEQLRYRLEAYASHHAGIIADGWRIAEHEQRLATTVQVDGEPFIITGQIDRIDRNAQGQYRLIDYKTSDSAKKPEQTHRKRVDGVKQWVDLQLPLYLDLSAELGVDRSAGLGYINLPKKTGDTGYEPAEWDTDAMHAARERRDFVIRQVRAGVFWPPKEAPGFNDGLAGVCGDEVADRMALIQASSVYRPQRDGGGA